MMKIMKTNKYYIFSLIFAALTVLCGNAWGEIANPYSFIFAQGDLTTSSTSFTKGEVTWNLSAQEDQWQSPGYRFGSGNNPKNLTISTNDISGTITEVTVTGKSNNNGKTAAVAVKVGISDFTTDDGTWESGSTQTLTFSGSASGTIEVSVTPSQCGFIFCGISVTYTTGPTTYTVTINKNFDSYGSVSKASVADLTSGTSISANGNVLTIGTTTVTATAADQDADYTYAFSNWSDIPVSGEVTDNITITANFTRTERQLENYRTVCCTELGAIGGAIALSQSNGNITANGWNATTGGNENGYLVRLYNSDKSSVITSANTGSKATKTHTFTNPGAGTYWISVSPTYSGAGNFCEIGTETFSASSITLTGNVVVTFKLNGGTVAGDAEKTQEVPVSTNTPLTSIATLGYVAPDCKEFVGWSTVQNGEKVYDDGDPINVAEATPLWAIWQTKTLSVAQGTGTATGCEGDAFTFPSSVSCGGNVTITSSPKSTHKTPMTITVLPADAYEEIDGNVIKNVTKNITSISVSYAEKQAATIKLHTINDHVTTVEGERLEGATYNLPTTEEACDETSLYGWYKGTYSHATDAPTGENFIEKGGQVTLVAGENHFYAVYATVTPDAADTYTKITTTEQLVSGDYLIVGPYNAKYYAMKNVVDDTSMKEKEVIVTTNRISHSGEGKTDYIWRITRTNDAITIKNGEDYFAVSSGVVALGASAENFTFSVSAEKWTLSSGDYNLQYAWYFEASEDATDPVYLFKRDASVSGPYMTNPNCTAYTLTVEVADPVAGGSAEAVKTSLSAGKTTTATATPANNDYKFTGWTISGTGATMSNTVDGKSMDNPVTITMGSADATLTAHFALKQNKTVTWNVNGDEDDIAPSVVKEGDKPTFPTNPSSCSTSSTVFYGWATSNWNGKLTDLSEKTVYTSADAMPPVNDNITYYAVFAEEIPDDNVKVLTQTLQYDDWTIVGTTTDMNSYRLFAEDAYVESAKFDLSTLKQVDVYAGTYGNLNNNKKKVTISDGTNEWNTCTLSTNKATTKNEITTGASLTGTGTLRVIAGGGDGSDNGIRISKVEIYTFGTSYTNFLTTCQAPVATPAINGVEADKVYETSKEITITCATDGATIYYGINAEPTTAYTGAFTVSEDGEYTIKAKATKAGMDDAEAQVSFSIVTPVAVTGVSLDVNAYTLKPTKTLQLHETVAPYNATNKNVTWSSDKESVATVDETGLVTAVAGGTAIITVTSVADDTKTATCTITVPEIPNFSNGDWQKVSSAAELTAGSYVIIAAASSNKAMKGYVSGNNCDALNATKNSDGSLLTYDSKFGVFEIDDYEIDEVTYKTFQNVEDDTYLFLSSNNNYLKSQPNKNANAAWTISVASNTKYATVTSKSQPTRYIQYNGSSTIFACYTGSQAEIVLYKYLAPVPKITYDKNTEDAVTGLPSEQRAELVGNENKAVIEAGPSRTGFNFIGWKDAEQNSYTVGTEYVFTADITLYAQWEAKPAYHVTYVATGNAPTDDTNYYEGDLVTLASGNNLSNPGYVFDGWNDGENTYAAGYDEYEMPNNDVIFTAVWSRKSNQKWILVTDENDIKTDGTEYVIAGASHDVAMAGLSGKIYTRTSVDKNDNILTGSESMTKLTFETGSASGKWAIKNGTKYIASTTVKEMTERADPFDWTITISDGVATISATVGSLKYNSSKPRFTTYASGQQGVAIYEKVANLIVDDEQTKTAAQVNASDITVKEDGKLTINVDADDKRIGDITVEDGGELIVTGSKHIKANNVYLSATMAGGKSSQMSGTPANLDIEGDVFFDITLGANGTNQQWHAFTVPFPVDVMNGIYDLNNEKLYNEVNYAIMEYHGDLRAKGEYGWKKIRTTLVPGTFYIMATDGYRTTYRFKKKAGEPLVAANSKDLAKNAVSGDGEDGKDNGWNGVGNPTLMYGKVGYNVYVLNPNPLVYDYELKIANSTNFVVGTPFFIQAADAGTMSMVEANASANYAPARVQATEIMNVDVTFGNEVYTDHLYISASEDALNEYQTGKDLVKMTMSNTPRVGRIFSNAYGHQLTMVYAPLSNDQASYDLSLYAPQAGTYSIAVPNDVDATIYLTYEGSIIWDLTASAYEIDLTKGTTEGYGLILRTNAPAVVTGVDQIDAKAGAQKVIIDEHVYILRGGQMYDVNGKLVK